MANTDDDAPPVRVWDDYRETHWPAFGMAVCVGGPADGRVVPIEGRQYKYRPGALHHYELHQRSYMDHAQMDRRYERFWVWAALGCEDTRNRAIERCYPAIHGSISPGDRNRLEELGKEVTKGFTLAQMQVLQYRCYGFALQMARGGEEG